MPTLELFWVCQKLFLNETKKNKSDMRRDMTFPCSSWIIFSSKCLEKEMVRSFIETSSHRLVQEQIMQAIRKEGFKSEDQMADALVSAIDYFSDLSEKSSAEEFAKAHAMLETWRRLGFLEMSAPFLLELDHLAALLEKNPLEKRSILESIEKLLEILSEKSPYQKREGSL